jgi:hypothetical protein
VKSFEFMSGVDSMTAKLVQIEAGPRQGQSYISFTGKGPKGGFVYGPGNIDEEYFDKLLDMIADARDWPYLCKGCGRAEDDCSADPCASVIADREA